MTLIIITGVGVFGSFLLPHLVNGADVLLDVINHFRQGDPSLSYKNGKLGRYWIRDAIYDRFYQVLREMLHRERAQRLCIISHSQGTVIAIAINLIKLAGFAANAPLYPVNFAEERFGSNYHDILIPPATNARWLKFRLLSSNSDRASFTTIFTGSNSRCVLNPLLGPCYLEL